MTARPAATPPVVLTIAGSDPSGGAGIQADLKVFTALGAYGAAVLTAVTAQNTRGVLDSCLLDAGLVRSQLAAVLDDLPVAAVKTGMLGSLASAAEIAAAAHDGRLPRLVVDPVLRSTSGSRLGDVRAIELLLPYACVITPNVHEAAALVGSEVDTPAAMLEAARQIAAGGALAVVVTGGDLPGAGGPGPGSVGGAGGVGPGGATGSGPGSVGGAGGAGPGGAAGGDATGSDPEPEPGAGGGAEPDPGRDGWAVDAVWCGQRGYLLRAGRVPTRNTHGSGCTFSAALAVRLAAGDTVPAALSFAKAYITRAIEGARGWRLGSGNGPVDHCGPLRSGEAA